MYQKLGNDSKTVNRYLYPSKERERYGCPIILRYQFTDENKLKISDKCCEIMKEKPLKTWEQENGKTYKILGLRRTEGGRRNRAKCKAFKNGKFYSFSPLAMVDDGFEDWFIAKYNIKLCELYYPPYNFKRTGCVGCPFNIKLQEELDILQELMPRVRKQCEVIWKPVYSEYRRIGYRLKKPYEEQMKFEFKEE